MGEEYLVNYGIKLKSLKKRAWMSQTDFGKVLGCDRKTLQRIETGAQLPNIEMQAKIAKFFNVPLYWFYILPDEDEKVS